MVEPDLIRCRCIAPDVNRYADAGDTRRGDLQRRTSSAARFRHRPGSRRQPCSPAFGPGPLVELIRDRDVLAGQADRARKNPLAVVATSRLRAADRLPELAGDARL